MRRRDFITLASSVAVIWPLAAHAQQSAMPVIGFLSGGSAAGYAPIVAAFRQGLAEAGYTEGQNLAIEYRWADGQYDRAPALAADLVARRVSVIVAAGGIGSALAAKAASPTIPIVFVTGDDPIRFGLVDRFNRPGGSVTGVSFLLPALEAKRLELLHELLPKATLIAVLVNPSFAAADLRVTAVREAANTLSGIGGTECRISLWRRGGDPGPCAWRLSRVDSNTSRRSICSMVTASQCRADGGDASQATTVRPLCVGFGSRLPSTSL